MTNENMETVSEQNRDMLLLTSNIFELADHLRDLAQAIADSGEPVCCDLDQNQTILEEIAGVLRPFEEFYLRLAETMQAERLPQRLQAQLAKDEFEITGFLSPLK
jgi:hypothetical protein